jgi:hypothetical protein
MKLRPRAGFIARPACIVPMWPIARCRAQPTTARLHRSTTHAQRAQAAHGLAGPRCMRPKHASSAHVLPCAMALRRRYGGASSGWRQAMAYDSGKRRRKGSGEALTSARGGVDGVAR